MGSFDLSETFKLISLKDPKYGRLVRALRNLEAARSANTDLEEARAALEMAGRVTVTGRGVVDPDGPIQIESLFVHALILYCKSTHSGSKARHHVDFLGSYTAELKADHKSITSIRDNVVAHYGTGKGLLSGPWNLDHVVLHLHPHGLEFSYPQMRVAHKAETVRALSRLIESSLDYVIKYATAKQDELATELRALLVQDKQIQAMLSINVFDEVKYFGFQNPPGSQNRVVVGAGEKPRK